MPYTPWTLAVSPSPMTFARPSILPELFASLPEPFAASFDPDAPWALLGEPLDAVLAGRPPPAVPAAPPARGPPPRRRVALGPRPRPPPRGGVASPALLGAGG